jgi:hypothetical protein
MLQEIVLYIGGFINPYSTVDAYFGDKDNL